MPPELRVTPPFERAFKNVITSYPSSRQDIIDAVLSSLGIFPLTCIRRIKSSTLYKTRLPLKAYRLSKREGLRYWFLHDSTGDGRVVPVFIVKKGEMKQEGDVLAALERVAIAVQDCIDRGEYRSRFSE